MEFPEGRGGLSWEPIFGKSRGGEGSYEKSLLWGVWIFSGTTHYRCPITKSSNRTPVIGHPRDRSPIT